MKLGARILKTGIAITLAIYAAVLLGIPSPAFAGIAAVFAIQPSIYRTYQTMLEQIQANIIGAFFAIIIGLTIGSDPLIIGLTAIIVIAINLQLKIESTIPIALVTVIAIMESPSDQFIQFALTRFGSVMLGVGASFLVNLIFIPPKYETKLYYKILDNTKDIIQWIRISSRHASEYTVIKDELVRLKEGLMKLDNLYLLYKEERVYSRKKIFAKGRKLVLFRQMLLTTNRALEILRKLHRHENEWHQLSEPMQHLIKEGLDSLLAYHEQMIFKYAGKIRSQASSEAMEDSTQYKKQLTNEYMKLYTENNQSDEQLLTTFSLVAGIIDYYDQLKHLDKLIDSFQTYHKAENEVKIQDKPEEH
ncbi:aromatic acid exporter family protein [Bacillus tianshenii]|nr:aromatic acid exporter family protein [Bacillus tianshenii]